MSATTTAPSPWPASGAAAQRPVWHFGRVLEVNGAPVLQWVSRRNCSLAPRQVLAVYLSLCAVSLTIAGVFTWLGAMPVLAYAGVELLLLGVAFLLYARHAADRETITLSRDALSVEHRFGSAIERADFRPAWVRVEPVHGEGSLLELSGEGRRVRVGRYVRPELRTPLARELRRALREQAPDETRQKS